MKDIFREVIRQLFGVRLTPLKPRGGTLILTSYTVRKMAEYKIDGETLENAFRFGVEYRTGKILHKYARHTIGLYYQADSRPVHINFRGAKTEKSYVVTTCWKGA